MTFEKYSKEKKQLLRDNIISFLENKKKKADLFWTKDVIDRLIKFTTEGKMLRGVFVLMSYESFGLKISKEVVDAAIAIEIAHSGFLIHDDIMDNDTQRRGEKTIFAQYGKNDYGKAMGICIGDITFFLCLEFLAKSKKEVIDIFAKELQRVGLSQMQDVSFGYKDYEPLEKEIMDLYKYKTARYSFSLPFLMGGLIANASSAQLKILEEFGENLGIVFQIRDDEIGILGNEEEIGKPVGSDIRENKKTLIRFILLSKASKDEKIFLKKVFGKKNITKKEIEQVKKLIAKLKIDKELEKRKEKFLENVLKLINSLKINNIYKNLFIELSNMQRGRIK